MKKKSFIVKRNCSVKEGVWKHDFLLHLLCMAAGILKSYIIFKNDKMTVYRAICGRKSCLTTGILL